MKRTEQNMTDDLYNKICTEVHATIWKRVWEQLEAQVHTYVIGKVRDLLRIKLMQNVRDDVSHQIEDHLERRNDR